MKSLKLSLFLTFVLCFAQDKDWRPAFAKLQDWPESIDLSISELDSLKVQFVDVRPFKERRVSVLPNAISLDEFEEKFESKALDLNLTYVAYCTIGYRSARFTEKWKKEGVELFNLKGGVLAWAESGRSFVKDSLPTDSVHVYGKDWNFLVEGYTPVW